jgi:hypothetical protein
MRPDPGDLAAGAFERSAFRLQRLPHYDTGVPGPPEWDALNGWLRLLRHEIRSGARLTRLKVMSPQLTPYEEYVCEELFTRAVGAGEQILVVDLAERDVPRDLLECDFWILDDARAVRLRYDLAGRYAGGEPVAVERCRAVRDALEALAEPFGSWWRRNTGDPGPRAVRPLRWRAAA